MHFRKARNPLVVGAAAVSLAIGGLLGLAPTAGARPAGQSGPVLSRILDKPIWGTQYADSVTPAQAAP
ncbi:MAG TPA: hypothetical protein VGP46_13155, partial [Acidimicrobiales bacterium]|nr:hypothetical protein [Acidimicrobiales bacterium]